MSCWAEKIKRCNIAGMSSLNPAIREGFLEEETSKDGSELLGEEAEASLVTVLRESASYRSYTQILGLDGMIHYDCVCTSLNRGRYIYTHAHHTEQPWQGDSSLCHSHNSQQHIWIFSL